MLGLQYRYRLAIALETYVIQNFETNHEITDLALSNCPQQRDAHLVQVSQHGRCGAKRRNTRRIHWYQFRQPFRGFIGAFGEAPITRSIGSDVPSKLRRRARSDDLGWSAHGTTSGCRSTAARVARLR